MRLHGKHARPRPAGGQAQRGRAYRVQGSDDLANWTTFRTLTGTNTPIVIRDTNAPPTRRFYRAVTP